VSKRNVLGDQPRPDWAPLPRPGCENVLFRVLLGTDGLFVANLRFAAHATIDEHSAPWDVDVICLSGSGFTSVGAETYALHEGQTARWPKDRAHRLWTESTEMETLMIERHGA